MENAIKYNRPNGRICLTVTENAEWIEVAVGNTGKPIPPELTPYIFQRFFRAHGSAERPGSGLGLSIARELAEANRGQLELVSSATDWTKFRLRLPLQKTPHQKEPQLTASENIRNRQFKPTTARPPQGR